MHSHQAVYLSYHEGKPKIHKNLHLSLWEPASRREHLLALPQRSPVTMVVLLLHNHGMFCCPSLVHGQAVQKGKVDCSWEYAHTYTCIEAFSLVTGVGVAATISEMWGKEGL